MNKEIINAALEDMPEDSAIKSFLTENKEDVVRMCIAEYEEQKFIAELIATGREEGTLDTLTGLVKKGILTLEQAAEEAQMTVAEFELKTKY